mmetsp:Transcript_26954/g.50329  ORF Transcript_26954/g.50329 Transcript_26954/m.50329 type:complete len:526 (-) Transcript_26954:136-1713(-)
MGGGGKRKGGGMRKAGKKAGGRARKAAHRAGGRARHVGSHAARHAGGAGRVGIRRGRAATRGMTRHTRAGFKASRRGITRSYHSTSRMAKRSRGVHFRMPGVKLRKFPSCRVKLPKMNISRKIHHSRYRRSHYGSHYDDPYYQNSSNGYHCYDDINSYSHRRFARTHRYHPPVNKDPEMVSYDSLRVTLPPDSPNFCFIPVTSLSMCGSEDEKAAQDADNFNVIAKVLALVSRPYSVDQTSVADLHATVTDLLNKSGTLLRGMDDPEDNGWYIPDWTGYGCVVGKSKQQRMDDFVEQEMEETADEIVVMWNKDPKIAARGITVSYVDIGDTFCGFSLEVLPYVTVPCSAVEGGGTLAANHQFFVAPSAPPITFSPAEMKTISFMSQTARGDLVDEEEYDTAFENAAQEFNTEEVPDITEEYTPFLVRVPEGTNAGSLLTVQSPDGVLYSVAVPYGAPVGSSILVKPGTLEQSDVLAAPYTPSDDSSPPSYAQSFYHSNADAAGDSTVPPPYDSSDYASLPPPPAY